MSSGIMTGRVTVAFLPGTSLALPFQDLKACHIASSRCIKFMYSYIHAFTVVMKAKPCYGKMGHTLHSWYLSKLILLM